MHPRKWHNLIIDYTPYNQLVTRKMYSNFPLFPHNSKFPTIPTPHLFRLQDFSRPARLPNHSTLITNREQQRAFACPPLCESPVPVITKQFVVSAPAQSFLIINFNAKHFNFKPEGRPTHLFDLIEICMIPAHQGTTILLRAP